MTSPRRWERTSGYTGSTLPTERRRNHRPRCATNRTVCAIGPSPAGVTEDPSLPPLGPTPLRISSQPLSRRSAAKNLSLRSLRSFAVYAAQDDVAPKRRWTRRFQDVVVQVAQPEIFRRLRG